MSDDNQAVRIAIDIEQHKALTKSKPYQETLRDWSSYVVAEGLHALEAQREADE